MKVKREHVTSTGRFTRSLSGSSWRPNFSERLTSVLNARQTSLLLSVSVSGRWRSGSRTDAPKIVGWTGNDGLPRKRRWQRRRRMAAVVQKSEIGQIHHRRRHVCYRQQAIQFTQATKRSSDLALFRIARRKAILSHFFIRCDWHLANVHRTIRCSRIYIHYVSIQYTVLSWRFKVQFRHLSNS